MKLLELIAAGASFTSLTSALTLVKRDNPAVVSFPISRRLVITENLEHTGKRAIPVPLTNARYYIHEVNLTMGSPAQSIRAIVDTGAGSLLVQTPKSDLCITNKAACSTYGAYDANSSSTYHYLNSELKAILWSGEETKGDYATDDITIGGVKVKSLQFGIMSKTNITNNILGLGLNVAKSIADPNAAPGDPLATLLVQQKYIESRAFSLWIHDLNLPGGELLFGGVDTSKYEGKLITVPFAERVRETVIDYSVVLNGVQMTDSKGGIISFPSQATPLFALLDSGAAQTILPDDIVSAIYSKLNANATNVKVPTVDCALLKDKSTIDFLFENSLKIKAALSQFILPAAQAGGKCTLWGLAKTSDVPYNTIILGNSFLSSAYVVFDMDNKEASMAQSKSKPGRSKILQITTGGNAVPGVIRSWNGTINVGKIVNGWQYVGCVKETAPRTLNMANFINDTMTIESCQAFCSSKNYQMAGVQFSKECWCGHVLSNGGVTGSVECTSPCKGNANQICGGPVHNSVFLNTDWIPTINPKIVNGFGYIGCFQELLNTRLLNGPSQLNQADMSAEKCTAFCRSKLPGVVWAGTQFSKECFCAIDLPKNLTKTVSEGQCNMECTGNKEEWCGSARKISLYKILDSA